MSAAITNGVPAIHKTCVSHIISNDDEPGMSQTILTDICSVHSNVSVSVLNSDCTDVSLPHSTDINKDILNDGVDAYVFTDNHDNVNGSSSLNHVVNIDNYGLSNHNVSSITVDQSELADPIHLSLSKLRSKYSKNLLFAHVNINSFRNKYDYIHGILAQNLLDFLAISETKLDGSFTNQQFACDGFNMYRNDSTSTSGGLAAYIRNDIPHRRRVDLESCEYDVQTLVIECLVRKEKWIVVACYKLPRIKNYQFVECISKICSSILSESSDVIIMGDFNVNMMCDNIVTQQICDIYDLYNIIDEPTCFKSQKGTLIDPVLVSHKKRILSSFNITCGASDWHNLVGCVTRIHMPRQIPTRIIYRSYKKFNDQSFQDDVGHIPFHVTEVFDDIDDQYWAYSKLLGDVLDEHAPLKKKTIRKNQVPYMNGNLRREIFYRNNLKNRYFRNRTNINWHKYKKQRNKVVGLRRSAIRAYFDKKCKSGSQSKHFWDTVKPFMTDKGYSAGNYNA